MKRFKAGRRNREAVSLKVCRFKMETTKFTVKIWKRTARPAKVNLVYIFFFLNCSCEARNQRFVEKKSGTKIVHITTFCS